MKRAIEEFRVGKWEQLAVCPDWDAADRAIDVLRFCYPLRQYRIVPIDDPPPQRAA